MSAQFDLLVIGGGINGCGIARDAAGRGLSVALVEMGDLGSATSSASTKLFHGGLRYLEQFELRLVREGLREREVLLRNAPHISYPMRFVLPYHPAQRFDSDTAVSRLLGRVAPWMKGRRPAWLIRAGLALYDGLAPRTMLPGTRRLSLEGAPEGEGLQDQYRHAFEFSDGWVDDARLVVLNARDAALRGARVLVRHKMISATCTDAGWHVNVEGPDGAVTLDAKCVVNAAGPWVARVLRAGLIPEPRRSPQPATDHGIRLVRGSHIITRRLFDHDKAYFLQGRDGRICFAIPYETDFTLIGTTDVDHADSDAAAHCSEAERDYLLAFANTYFKQQITPEDVVWTYSGLRALRDTGDGAAQTATRDYELRLETQGAAPVLHVFGGKLTTYRKLAEAALAKLDAVMAALPGPWTADAPLPGGDFEVGGAAGLARGLRAAYPFLSEAWAMRLTHAYGTDARHVLGGARAAADLGQTFAATLTEAEIRWMQDNEFAQTADDVLWRRSKLGLHMTDEERAGVAAWMADNTGLREAAAPPQPARARP